MHEWLHRFVAKESLDDTVVLQLTDLSIRPLFLECTRRSLGVYSARIVRELFVLHPDEGAEPGMRVK